MNMMIFPEDVVNVIRSFYLYSNDDKADADIIILSIGAELLGISQDKMLEMIS